MHTKREVGNAKRDTQITCACSPPFALDRKARDSSECMHLRCYMPCTAQAPATVGFYGPVS